MPNFKVIFGRIMLIQVFCRGRGEGDNFYKFYKKNFLKLLVKHRTGKWDISMTIKKTNRHILKTIIIFMVYVQCQM